MKWYEKIANSRKPDLIVQIDGKVYLKRWWLLPRNRFFNVFLHKFEYPDEHVFHDHPWHSLSYVLKGRIVESFPQGGRLCQQGSWYFRKATQLHFLDLVDQKPAWTLFITGPTIREWGFQTADGWKPCFQYTRRPGVAEFKNYERDDETESKPSQGNLAAKFLYAENGRAHFRFVNSQSYFCLDADSIRERIRNMEVFEWDTSEEEKALGRLKHEGWS